MTVLCMICQETLPDDDEYLEHMQTKHGSKSPDKALQTEKAKKANLPKNLPPGIPEEALPTPEFLETVAAIEEAESKPQVTTEPQKPIVKPAVEVPIELEYHYKGKCKIHGVPVETIVIPSEEAKMSVVSAYCLSCHQTLEQKKVHSI